jgi:hypothetical protein
VIEAALVKEKSSAKRNKEKVPTGLTNPVIKTDEPQKIMEKKSVAASDKATVSHITPKSDRVTLKIGKKSAVTLVVAPSEVEELNNMPTKSKPSQISQQRASSLSPPRSKTVASKRSNASTLSSRVLDLKLPESSARGIETDLDETRSTLSLNSDHQARHKLSNVVPPPRHRTKMTTSSRKVASKDDNVSYLLNASRKTRVVDSTSVRMMPQRTIKHKDTVNQVPIRSSSAPPRTRMKDARQIK